MKAPALSKEVAMLLEASLDPRLSKELRQKSAIAAHNLKIAEKLLRGKKLGSPQQ